jgi:alkane 1-monooxygenase
MYMHFTIEHIYGHHKRVATPEDPASAPKGMTLGQFIPRSIIGGFKSALNINPKFVMLTIIADVVFLAWMWKLFGFRGVFLVVLLAIGSINMLETINYVEHYGLERKKLPDG